MFNTNILHLKTYATRLDHQAAQWLPGHQRRIMALLAAWLLSMIFVPISRWTWGEGVTHWWLTVSVLLQATAVFEILRAAWGTTQAVRAFLIVALFTFSAEYLGSSWGIPFGHYDYTGLLQPQLGHVPLLIPAAWFMMLPAAWVIAAPFRHSRWRFALVSALALTAWDLLLDPQMVAWGMWVWDNPYGYFGIPWSNYAGWLLTAFLVTLLVRPNRLPAAPLLFIYTATWFLKTFGLALFWEMGGPALVGGLVMGLFALYGWRRSLER